MPDRSPDVPGDVRLIDVFATDNEIVGLLRHLFRVHGIVTLAELDTAGWNVINTFPDKLSDRKRRKFFGTIGKPSRGEPVRGTSRVLAFAAAPARLG